MKLIGLDTGLASFGIAVAEVTSSGVRFERLDVWRTVPASAKRRLRKADDTADRVRTLAGYLHELIIETKPVALCVEAIALPFGRARSSVVSALGRARGIVDAIAEVHRLPVLEETPQRLKHAVAGAQNATKEAVRGALEATYAELRALWPVQATLVEHAADAAAAIHACRGADVVLAALRARSAA